MFSRLSPRDAWEIKKTLQASDLGNLLILETNFVKNLIFSYLGNKTAQRVETKAGAQVVRFTAATRFPSIEWNRRPRVTLSMKTGTKSL